MRKICEIEFKEVFAQKNRKSKAFRHKKIGDNRKNRKIVT